MRNCACWDHDSVMLLSTTPSSDNTQVPYSDDVTRMLIHSFVVTRVDYCNSVLSGITVVQTDRVQRILSAAARLLLRIPKFAPVAALIRDHLHWLPATKRIRFKIPLLVSKCIHRRAPSYLQQLCVPASTVVGRRNL